ncbi:hypothetical protein Ciccas_001971 [Cichlidogyrus casuarinus]|uniref:DDE-1 domain-containing protein n=1 Tax=Cichlidogyrus casuarinus TaxID=1844966 RepID=A0ABD2QJL5_9PLAT
MVRRLFKSWVQQFDRDMSSKGKRALFVLDNFSGHTKLEEDPAWTPLIATELLGTTADTKPLDQGILNSLKCSYKRRMHQEFISYGRGSWQLSRKGKVFLS